LPDQKCISIVIEYIIKVAYRQLATYCQSSGDTRRDSRAQQVQSQ